ncbi:MAG: hypothetical protein AB7L13_25000 [Acidimicrobiia bacterium]
MIAALDLSLTATGWATLDPTGDLRWGTITPPARGHPIGARLDHLRQAVADLAADAHLVVLETPVVRSPAALTLGMVHGAVQHRLHELGRAVLLVAPATLKVLATGKGNAGKADVRGAARTRLGYTGESDDEADACWLADLGARYLGWTRPPLPATHLRAMVKIHGVAA